MPPCYTTNINSIDHPNFSITLYHPTTKHPNPPLPQYTAITAQHINLPTHHLFQITIAGALPLHAGDGLNANELKELISQRMSTWANPMGAE
eukprot:4487955-Karenia_brevis.AAC.1